MSLFDVLIPLAVFGAIVFSVLSHQKMVQQWESLPTLRQYLLRYPECKTEHGIRCCRCASGSIRNWGMSNSRDVKRTFICNQCGTELYRSS